MLPSYISGYSTLNKIDSKYKTFYTNMYQNCEFRNKLYKWHFYIRPQGIGMLGEPQSEIDIGDLFGTPGAVQTDYESIFREEFECIFGTMGSFIIKKQLDDITKGEEITDERLPFIIDKLTQSVVSIVGPDAAKDLKRSLRRRCGLPV